MGEIVIMQDNDSYYKNFYEAVCKVLPVGVFKTDQFGKIIYVNEKYVKISGIDNNQSLNDGWLDAVHCDDHKLVLSTWKECLCDKKNWCVEFRFRTKNGKITWVLAQAEYSTSCDGFIGTITNISKKKILIEEILEIKKQYQNKISIN